MGILALCAVGCAAEKSAPGPQAVADVKQVMSVILEPAADTYWDAVGTIIDTTGTQEIAPKNAEEWAEVWRAALVVAESGNLLMVEGRARDRDQWMRLARQMVDAGQKAMTAAESKDPAKVFEAGGEMYEVCTACHSAYAQHTLPPSHDSTKK
jgi:hypothetical protein